MTNKIKSVLIEAYRRFISFNRDKDIYDAWVGLGYPSHYKEVVKAGLMTPINKEQKGVSNWYKLTHKGVSEMIKIIGNEKIFIEDCTVKQKY